VEKNKILNVCKGKVVPELNWLSAVTWRHTREWRYSSTVLDLDTRWRWVVSFTPLSLYPRGRSPWYPLHRGGWVVPRVGLDAVEAKKSCTARNRTRAVQPDWAIPTPCERKHYIKTERNRLWMF
jgi:hypothetical protein